MVRRTENNEVFLTVIARASNPRGDAGFPKARSSDELRDLSFLALGYLGKSPSNFVFTNSPAFFGS
jgi:hypothetical protein